MSLIVLCIGGKDEDSDVDYPFEIGLSREWFRAGFLGNPKEQEGDSNEIKFFWGVVGGDGHVDEPRESQLRISFNFSFTTLDSVLIIYLISLKHEKLEKLEIVEE